MTNRFVWLRMRTEIQQWVKAYVSCQKAKVRRHTCSPPGSFPSSDEQFDHAHVDITEPLPVCEGQLYLLMCLSFLLLLLLYWHLLIHAEIYIYMLDSYRCNDNRRSDKDRCRINDAGRLLYKNILPLTLLQGFERVVQGLHVRGSWRPNINCNIYLPVNPTVMTVTLCLVLLMLGSTPSGFPRTPSVGCGFPYHIWSLAVWNPPGNCFLDSKSTELNNNSTPTRSPTGSLKLNV